MKNILRPLTGRPSALALLAFTAGLTTIQASIVTPSTTLPPPNGIYTLSPTCLTPVCVANIMISGFQNVSDVVVGGDELVSANATMSAGVFQNAGGSAGVFVGSIAFVGTIDFTFFGRTTPLGTFNAQITGFQFAGTFNGHTIVAQANSSQASTGVTTVEQLPGVDGMFRITSFFDVFAELSIDGGPFVPGPVRHTELTAAPEPAGIGLTLFGLAGVVGVAVRRRAAAK